MLCFGRRESGGQSEPSHNAGCVVAGAQGRQQMEEYETIKRARATLQVSRTDLAECTVATFERRARVLMQQVISEQAGRLQTMISGQSRAKAH